MLGMLGRGGDGQKIRDEILNIMHRNNIKELKVLVVQDPVSSHRCMGTLSLLSLFAFFLGTSGQVARRHPGTWPLPFGRKLLR